MIVQLFPFDIATAEVWQIMASSAFWASLPRIAPDNPSARLLICTDTLDPSLVVDDFNNVSVNEDHLPLGLRSLRQQYLDFLKNTLDEIHRTRVYLIMHPKSMTEDGLCDMLSPYGITAQPLDHRVPIPFEKGYGTWRDVVAEDGIHWGLLRSKPRQTGAIFARTMHGLFSHKFPLWVTLNISAFEERATQRMLRTKAAMAKYERRDQESIETASEITGTIGRLRAEMSRAGGALHTVRLSVVFGAETSQELVARQELLRSSIPMDMEPVRPPAAEIRALFSTDPLVSTAGAVVTSPGAALLAGSAMSYRRRSETQGVFLGVDSHNAPIIAHPFDPRYPSFNSVILGQTGKGKTFFALLYMLRAMQLGVRLVIIDPQGNVDFSFLGEDICQRVVVGTEQARTNPLQIAYDELPQQIESVCATLSLLGVFDRSDSLARSLLDEALLDIYVPIWERNQPAPTLGALQTRIQQMSGGRAINQQVRDTAQLLAYKMAPYTSGSYSGLFGGQTNIDFGRTKPIMVYDVSKLPGNNAGGGMRSAMLAVLVANINTGIRELRASGNTAPILFFVDEMGVLMRDPFLAGYVRDQYKTARSRNVGMVIADQDLASLLGPVDPNTGAHFGASMLANAASTFWFYHKGSEQVVLRETFPDLPDPLFRAIFQFQTGTCLAQFPNDLVVVHVRASSLERVILSSRLQDRQRAGLVIERMSEELRGVQNAQLGE